MHLLSRFGRLIQPFVDKPGVFYAAVLTTVFVVQGLNVLAFVRGDQFLHAQAPPYTHALSICIGTIFLFRGLQLLGALAWVSLFGAQPIPAGCSATREDLPIVTVQIPVRNEPLEVAKISIDSAFELEYPPGKLEIQVIDNSDSAAAYRPIQEYLERKADEASEQGRRPMSTFLHRDGTAGFKAGNLNLGMTKARGSFFLILDADSSTPADTLLAALPYFEDPRLGFVQLRIDAANEDENIVTAAASISTRMRYLLMGIRATQGVVQFDGHSGIFRREALESVGGWVEQISEDLATSIKVLLAGYRSRFADLPSEELVVSRFPELMRQRGRWAAGTMHVLRHETLPILRSSRLRWFEKLDLLYSILNIFVEGSTYLLVFTFAPLPAAVFLQILLVFSVLPACLAYRFRIGQALRRQASAIFVISAILPSLVLGALRGLSGGRQSFAVTQKKGGRQLSFGRLIRLNAFGFASSLLFFAVGMSLSPSLLHFFNNYLAGTIIMGSALTAPILLNYSRAHRGAPRA